MDQAEPFKEILKDALSGAQISIPYFEQSEIL
jgi:hypothetical protein